MTDLSMTCPQGFMLIDRLWCNRPVTQSGLDFYDQDKGNGEPTSADSADGRGNLLPSAVDDREPSDRRLSLSI